MNLPRLSHVLDAARGPHSYLFRSSQVADICAHFTSEEDGALTEMERSNGFIMGLAISAPLLAFIFFASRLTLWHIPIVVSFQIVIAVLGAGLIRRRLRDFLASTHYARSRGFTAHDIRYYEFKKTP